MECTPRRVRKRKSTGTPLFNTSNYDAFADCPEFSPVVSSDKEILLFTPQQPDHRKSSRRSRKSCDSSLLQLEHSSPFTPRGSNNDFSFRSPLSEKQKRFSSESNLLQATPASLGKNFCSDANITPTRNTKDLYKAMLDGKRLVEEILKRSKAKAKPFSKSTPDITKVSGISPLLSEKLNGKELSAQSGSSSRRCIDYSDCPQLKPSTTDSTSEDAILNNSLCTVNADENDDLPPTQPVSAVILQGVVAYVEVRSTVDKEGKGVKDELQKLGAVVANSFNKKVTHVVFMNGKMSTYKKAVERKVPLVSVLWIEACKRQKAKVSEKLFPSSDIEKLQSPDVHKSNTKKSLFPTLRALKRMTSGNQKKKAHTVGKEEQENVEPLQDTFEARESLVGPKWAKEVSNGNGLVQALITVAKFSEEQFKEIVNKSDASEANEDELPVAPLAVRLLRKLVTSKGDDMDSPISSKDISSCQSQIVVSANENTEVVLEGQCKLQRNTAGLCSNYTSDKLCGSVDSIESTPKRNSLCLNQVLSPGSEKEKHIATDDNNSSPITSSKAGGPKKLISSLEETLSVESVKEPDIYNVNESQQTKPLDVGTQSNNSERRNRKRKLLPLSQNPTILTPTDEEPPNELTQNPYLPDKALNKKVVRATRRYAIQVKKNCRLSKAMAESPEEMAFMVTSSRRKSTSLEFVNIERRQSQRIIMTNQIENSSNSHLPSLVCTGLHSEEVGVIMRVVGKLGRFAIEDHVSSRTTHVITKEPKRTLKLLKGMARGCWIVKQDWVLRSLEEEKWLEEEEFELTEFSPAVQQYRLEKMSFGPAYEPDLFSSCGLIFVKKSTKNSPPKEDIEELVTLCGGKVTSNFRSAKIIIGHSSHLQKDMECVSVLWILDSISNNMLQAKEKYLMQKQMS